MNELNLKKFKIKNICCIGAGYVGGPTMAVIADNCKDLKVTVVDINKEKIDSWNNADLDKIPIFEPKLKDILKRVRGRNLFFSNDVNNSIKEADMIFISVNTPVKESGLGAGQASDLKWVESSARTISEESIGHTIVVEKSTLPVRTAQVIKDILISAQNNQKEKSNQKTFSVLSNPEFLAEGTAIDDLVNPNRVLIGGEDSNAIESLKKIYLNWVPIKKIICTNLWSSELSKLTANAFLAQRISSINSISALCEVTGANVNEVALAVGTDNRIGSRFLESGPGFGGSCFRKDILNLVYLCNFYGLKEVADYWIGVIKINDWQQKRIYNLVVRKLYGNLSLKKIAVLGFSFKANTNDTRDSPAIHIVKDFLSEGAKVSIHDPKVSKAQISENLKIYKDQLFKNDSTISPSWEKNKDIYESVSNADAIILLTSWEEYKKLDWDRISSLMRKPSWVFDTRSFLNQDKVESYGINFWSIGNGA
tara:strand:- start:1991 stop:3430 length:1440 start_codon:yes stop_codon:yes gene_type:complete